MELCAPEDVFSQDEREKISRFSERSEWIFGELDVLRDRNTGRIYIIDPNNTPMGQPKALNKEEASRTFATLLPPFRSTGESTLWKREGAAPQRSKRREQKIREFAGEVRSQAGFAAER